MPDQIKSKSPRPLLRYVVIACLFYLFLRVTSYILMLQGVSLDEGDLKSWCTRLLSFPFNIPMWLSWKFGIQGVLYFFVEIMYCMFVGLIIGMIGTSGTSKLLKTICLAAFVILFFWLNFVSEKAVWRDMEKLGKTFGELLQRDPDRAREFIKDELKKNPDFEREFDQFLESTKQNRDSFPKKE